MALILLSKWILLLFFNTGLLINIICLALTINIIYVNLWVIIINYLS